MSASDIGKFLLAHGYSMTIIICAIIIVFIIMNVDKVLMIKSEVLGWFSKFFSWAKKGQISNKVRATILRAVREKSVTNPEILPTDLKVEWVKDETPSAFVNKNQVIVRIKQSSNIHENLVVAVSAYVNEGLLHNVRRYLHKSVVQASKVYMTRKIVQSAGTASLTYLDEQYIFPQLRDNIVLKELYEQLAIIDRNGMFVGILLNEFQKVGMSIHGEIEDPELIAESKEFFRFLYDIALGVSNDYERLCFNRDYFKVVIFLTASNRTLQRSGIRPFIRAISQKLDEGIETIYVFGLGRKQEIAGAISQEIDQKDFRIHDIKKHEYRHIGENGRRVAGVFYECSIFKD